MSNKKKNAYIFDIEADGLLDTITKIHCLAYIRLGESEIKTETDYEKIKEFFLQEDLTLIGHNIITYDIPAVERVLNISVRPKRVVDTLGISWYIHSSKDASYKHGLEQYGERYGVEKPSIENWSDQSIEDYLHRCREDVRINCLLWIDQQKELMEVYERNSDEVLRLIDYISFKLSVVREQEENPTKLDTHLIKNEINRLSSLRDEKLNILIESMPKKPIVATRTRPKVMYKKDGTLSVSGEKWFQLLLERNLPEYHTDSIEVITGYDEPNPSSHTQIKDWLFSLGWEPKNIKIVRDKKTNETRDVPQIASADDRQELCESVKKLADKEPAILELSSLFTISHRITVFEGFLKNMNKDGTISWGMGGFTNTMRLKHRGIVNLPKVYAPFAENIRASIIADDDGYLVGSDLSNIEDMTKRIYIYPYDPEYVKEQMTEGFDSHMDIAVRSGLLTEEQAQDHKNKVKDYSEERNLAKIVNFSSVYGVGVKTLARSMGRSEKEAKRLLDGYWERNWAVKKFSSMAETKVVNGQMWVKQPISKFWYTLRGEKDIFSTVNQSSAVFIFDKYCEHIRRLGFKLSGSMHDEIIFKVKYSEMKKEEVSGNVKNALKNLNDELKLVLDIKADVDFGRRYSDIH